MVDLGRGARGGPGWEVGQLSPEPQVRSCWGQTHTPQAWLECLPGSGRFRSQMVNMKTQSLFLQHPSRRENPEHGREPMGSLCPQART